MLSNANKIFSLYSGYSGKISRTLLEQRMAKLLSGRLKKNMTNLEMTFSAIFFQV